MSEMSYPRPHAAVPPGAAVPQDRRPSREALEALRARGVPVPLATGEQVRLRYSMDALDRLEGDFGNIGNVLGEMREAERALMDSLAVAEGDADPETQARHAERQATGTTRSLFSVICRALLPGLADAQATHPRTGELFYLEDDPRAARQLLDVAYIRLYVSAFSDAFAQAFYAGDQPQGGGAAHPPQPTPTPSADPSPGPTGGTSAPSWDTGQTPSSGA